MVRSESTIFLLGVVAIAVHLVDDSFLQPEPGTSPADHLVSGNGRRGTVRLIRSGEVSEVGARK